MALGKSFYFRGWALTFQIVLIFVFVLSAVEAGAAQSLLGCADCFNFVAPAVLDADNIDPAEVGLIVYESSSDSFKGNTLSGGWVALSRDRRVPTIQVFSSGSGTYSTPAGVLYLRVRMVGGGGGGGAASFSGSGTGGNGGDTSFNSIVAKGGGGGPYVGAPYYSALGGSGGGGTAALRIAGGGGSSAVNGYALVGGVGGSSAFGGAARSAGYSAVGEPAAAGSGSGGSGGNSGGTCGGSGGAGEYVEVLVPTPAPSYSYSVGGGGAGGPGGAAVGGSGGSGFIEVTEHYQ